MWTWSTKRTIFPLASLSHDHNNLKYPSLRCTKICFHQLKQYPNLIHEVINVSGKYLPLFSLDLWPLHRDAFEGEHQQQQEGDVSSLSLLFPVFPFSLLWSAPIFVDPASWFTSASSSPSLAWSTITQLFICFESLLHQQVTHLLRCFTLIRYSNIVILMICLSRAVPDSKAFHCFQQSTCSLISDDSHRDQQVQCTYMWCTYMY